MELSDLSFVGPPIDDRAILDELPLELATILQSRNGFVAFRGGLHVRGACTAPEWHGLRNAWRGERALSMLFRSIRSTDVPFAQDALGDQYVLRDETVWRLDAESDVLEPQEASLVAFLRDVERDPISVLRLQPLLAFEAEGGRLEPGQLLSVYPPFVANTDQQRSYRAISGADGLGLLALLAERIRNESEAPTITPTYYRSEVEDDDHGPAA